MRWEDLRSEFMRAAEGELRRDPFRVGEGRRSGKGGGVNSYTYSQSVHGKRTNSTDTNLFIYCYWLTSKLTLRSIMQIERW